MVERFIQLTKIDGRQERARILNYTPIRAGTRSSKGFIDLQRENSSNISHMIQRRVEYADIFRGERTPAEHYMYLWQSLKDAGLTVIDEVVALSSNKIAETNLTHDGSKIYGKDTNIRNSDSPIDVLFKQVDLDAVRKEAIRQAKLASHNHIMLSADHSFDLILKPDGTWVVMARDIKNTICDVQYSVEGENEEKAKRFVDIHLVGTLKNLSKT